LALHYRFNGWAKYDDYEHDQQVATIAASHFEVPCRPVRHTDANGQDHWVVMEGGSVEGNGDGCLLTTEECLLSDVQARNPGLGRTDLEEIFRREMGIQKTLWLHRGIVGDDTHGHIDDLARFTDESTIVAVMEDDPKDPNHEPLKENLMRLREMTDRHGRPFRIATLPMPSPVEFRGQRLPASYANFYIGNAATLVPVFNDPRDRLALNILQDLIPDRPVHPINCRDLVLGLGTLHCMTQQVPAA
jgi:agmatine deiminase